MNVNNKKNKLKFIDLFAGCGGLSLGLLEAGHQGVFAVERSPLAFETMRHNLIDGRHHAFEWPEWLPKSAMPIELLLERFSSHVKSLKGQVDLIVGGPPCQGFSMAGKRDAKDPRNVMTEHYLKLVGLINPRYLIIENVAGYNMSFDASGRRAGKKSKSTYADYVAERLENLGYAVSRGLVNCADYGVPQNRVRYLFLCEKNETATDDFCLFEELQVHREQFLVSKGLPTHRPITVKEAIEDLTIRGKTLQPNIDSDEKIDRYEIAYKPPKGMSEYLRLMRMRDQSAVPNSLRLAKHKANTVDRFRMMHQICSKGRTMTETERKILGTKKIISRVLDPFRPSPTITTMPDDVIHYDEPRVLTVRENARIQSFPDWFEFRGKYTTGGERRRFECPRYTQVGNAVPPLLASAIGSMLSIRKKS